MSNIWSKDNTGALVKSRGYLVKIDLYFRLISSSSLDRVSGSCTDTTSDGTHADLFAAVRL